MCAREFSTLASELGILTSGAYLIHQLVKLLISV